MNADGPAYGEAFAALYGERICQDISFDKYSRYVDGLIRGRRRGLARVGAQSGDQGCAQADAQGGVRCSVRDHAQSGAQGCAADNKIVADLGCGTGEFAIGLARLGYDVIGVDASEAMLNIAGQRASDAGADILFLLQDMSAFELYGTVGAITSTIDAMNYVATLGKLRRVFKLASNYLDPGGLFIFDVNTESRYENELDGKAFVAESLNGDAAAYWRTYYEAHRKIALTDISVFVKRPDGAYDRHDETHRQRCHSDEEIRGAASEAGLRLIGTYGFLTSRRPRDGDGKINYVFMKPTIASPMRAVPTAASSESRRQMSRVL